MKKDNKSEYEIMCNLAADYLKLILNSKNKNSRNFDLASLILGNGIFLVKKNAASEHNYHAVIDEIYKFKKENPTSDIDKLIDEAIRTELIEGSLENIKYLSRAIGIYDYILKSEKNGNASFQLDVKDYLKQTKESLKLLSTQQKNQDIDKWFNEQEEYLKNRHFR